MIITFCGHADSQKTPALSSRLLTLLAERVGDTPAEFYLGGYGGFDSFAYEVASQYQKTTRGSRSFLSPPTYRWSINGHT